MATPKEMFNAKRAEVLIKNLTGRHFGACYCATKEEALQKALSLIPEGSKVGWGGAMSAQEIGLLDALEAGNWNAVGRNTDGGVDVFITGANGLSLDGQMVNIDGLGNRVSAIIYGPKTVVVIAGILWKLRYSEPEQWQRRLMCSAFRKRLPAPRPVCATTASMRIVFAITSS